MADEEVRKREEARKAEEDRIAAEREFLERHERERRLTSQRNLPSGGYNSATSSQAESESEAEKKKRLRSPDEKEKKRAKSRKTEDGDNEMDDEEDEDLDDPLVKMGHVLSKMQGWFKQPTIMKMVTKPQSEKFHRYFDVMLKEMFKAREERARLEARIEERSALVSIVREELKKGLKEEAPKALTGYADAVRSAPQVPKVTGVKGPVLPAPKLVLVKHETKESEEVKATLKRLVKPGEIGLKVRRLTNIRNGVLVEAENEEGAENLLKLKTLREAGLKVEKPSRKKPVVMIYDVGADLKDEDIKNEVFSRNLRGSEISRPDFEQEFVLRHKYKDKKSESRKNHIVVECSVRVRNWLRSREKVFIEWQGCRVKDYVDVARCFKCQKYGHIAKHCNSVKPCCSYCSGEHDYKECPNKNKKDSVCCANCKREGRTDVKHDAASKKCPAYDKAVKRQNDKIDYGL